MRQDHELWSDLHSGVLTSSTLFGVTALCERLAAKLIPGWPQYMLSHSSSLFAAARLAQPLHASFHAPSAADVRAAVTRNHRVMRHLNSHKLERQEAAGRAACRRPSASEEAVHADSTLNQPCNHTNKSLPGVATTQGTTQASYAAAAPHYPHSDAGLLVLQRRGVDISWLGQHVSVQLSSSVGPSKRRTKVWSLQSLAPPAATGDASTSFSIAGESTTTDLDSTVRSEWLQGTTAAHPTAHSKSRKKRSKKSKRGHTAAHNSGENTTDFEPTATHEQQEVLRNSTAAHSPSEMAQSADVSVTTPNSCTAVQDPNPNSHRVGETASTTMLSAPEVDPLETLEHEAFLQRVHMNAQLTRPKSLVEARQVASQGEGRMRTTFGSVQEASALLEVLHMFKHSTVHEAGLCMLDPNSVPQEWGIDMQTLQVGASPDALIFHPPRDAGAFLLILTC